MGRCLSSPTSDRVHRVCRRTVSVRGGLLVLVAQGSFPDAGPGDRLGGQAGGAGDAGPCETAVAWAARICCVNEARLEDAGSGLAPVTEGWFVVNVRDAEWFSSGAGGCGVLVRERVRRASNRVRAARDQS